LILIRKVWINNGTSRLSSLQKIFQSSLVGEFISSQHFCYYYYYLDTTDIEDGVETSGSSGSERERGAAPDPWRREGARATQPLPSRLLHPLSLPRIRSFNRETSFQNEGFVSGTFHRYSIFTLILFLTPNFFVLSGKVFLLV
jgi:hypothetical protein